MSRKKNQNKSYSGKRIMYDNRQILSEQGTEICGYMRLQTLDGNIIRGHCSLGNVDCEYKTNQGDPMLQCSIYQRWIKERIKNRKK